MHDGPVGTVKNRCSQEDFSFIPIVFWNAAAYGKRSKANHRDRGIVILVHSLNVLATLLGELTSWHLTEKAVADCLDPPSLFAPRLLNGVRASPG